MKSVVSHTSALLAALALSLGSACYSQVSESTDVPDADTADTSAASDTGAADAGTKDTGAADTGATTSEDPPASLFEGPVKCTSGSTATARKGNAMKPGEACIACHTARGEGPTGIAGTVYLSGREADSCNAKIGAGTTVTITGADGKVLTLNADPSSGSFSSDRLVAKPYTAKVTRNGKSYEMHTPQTSGDCNSCHTAEGNGAAGRIVAP